MRFSSTSAAKNSCCLLCKKTAYSFSVVDGVQYFECVGCDFIFADPELIASIDQGTFSREYDNDYWLSELSSARERSFGSSLARLGEALLYCTIPVNRFIDIGTGPGYLLDAVSLYMPGNSSHFYGVEKFPPDFPYRSKHPNYLCMDLANVGLTFECGLCVEVIEHLTPTMARSLAVSLRSVSVPGSLFLFNTGLTSYVRNEDPGYLDPYGRGHVTCWSVNAARQIFEPHGFLVKPISGKSWAFVVELNGDEYRQEILLENRIWSAEPSNIQLLHDPVMGSAMHILAMESARAYL